MRRWLNRLRRDARGSVRSADDLAEFLSRQAAFVAQKCSDGYCRAKVGVAHYALAEEQAFKDANAVCRWEAYAEMLAAMMALSGRSMVEAGSAPEATDQALGAMYARILTGQPQPAHRAGGWGDMIAALPARLAAARAEPQPRLVDIAAVAGRRLFDVLPIHANHRDLDEEIVVNSVKFQFVGFSDKFRRQVDLPAVMRDLAVGGAAANGAVAAAANRA